jgi:hypothetical protein
LYLNHRLVPQDLQREIRFRENYWERLLTPQKAAAAEKLSAQAEHDPHLIQNAYELDAKLVSNDFEDNDTLIHPALSVPLELHEWAFMDEWLLQQGAQSTSVDAHDYEEIVAALDPTIKVVATDLRPDATLISMVQTGIGHVVIITRQATKPPRLWRIDANLPSQGSDAEQLRCWRPMAGVRPCDIQDIGLLPNDAGGAARFYIEAGYAQVAGATTGHQLSIWRWNGAVATPLYVNSFLGMPDAEQEGVHVNGNTIRIVQKEYWDILDPCGACDGRQMARLLRLTSHGVLDEGTVSLTPELDLINEIYSRIKAGQSAEGLASPSALQIMRQSWAPMEHRSFQHLFINMPEEVTHEAGMAQLCFRAYHGMDEPMTPALFTFAKKGRDLRIIDVRLNVAGCMP